MREQVLMGGLDGPKWDHYAAVILFAVFVLLFRDDLDLWCLANNGILPRTKTMLKQSYGLNSEINDEISLKLKYGTKENLSNHC